jgi:hypothetical protein
MVVNASTIVTVELIDEITVIAGPILALTIGIDMITAATTAVMTATISATTIEVIVVMIAMMIVTTTDETTDMMIDVARMTTAPLQQPEGADSAATQRGQPHSSISEG